VVLVGTTASGKSDMAFALASARPGVEIVSVDSMSVYRGMDIATAKPPAAAAHPAAVHPTSAAHPTAVLTSHVPAPHRPSPAPPEQLTLL